MAGKVRIKVVEAQGTCVANHKIGDIFVQEGEVTVGGMCSAAYNALYPYILALLYDAEFPYAGERNTLRLCCPDPANPMVFELEKIK